MYLNESISYYRKNIFCFDLSNYCMFKIIRSVLVYFNDKRHTDIKILDTFVISFTFDIRKVLAH